MRRNRNFQIKKFERESIYFYHLGNLILEVKKMKKFWKKISSWSPEAKTGLVLSLAATTVLGGVLLFESFSDNGVSNDPNSHGPSVSVDVGNNPNSTDDPVVEQEETFVKPFTVNATASRYYFDMADDEETRLNAVVEVPGSTNKYMKSVGVDYTYTGGQFNVVASLSGLVKDIISDPTYGEMVYIEHANNITTVYSSLKDVKVKKGDNIAQGSIIAMSGESLYTSELGNSLHFEVLKGNSHLNPEKVYSSLVSNI